MLMDQGEAEVEIHSVFDFLWYSVVTGATIEIEVIIIQLNLHCHHSTHAGATPRVCVLMVFRRVSAATKRNIRQVVKSLEKATCVLCRQRIAVEYALSLGQASLSENQLISITMGFI
jgi:hypothetical protein